MSQPYPYGSTTAPSGRQTPFARPSAAPTGPARPTVILRLPDLRRPERATAPSAVPMPNYAAHAAAPQYGAAYQYAAPQPGAAPGHAPGEAPYSAAPTTDWRGVRHPVQFRYDPAWPGYGAPPLVQRLTAPFRGLLASRPHLWMSGAILLALQAILGLLYLLLTNSSAPVQTLPAPSIHEPVSTSTASHAPAVPPTALDTAPPKESEAELALRSRANRFTPRSNGNTTNGATRPSSSTPRIDMPQPTLAPPRDKKNDPPLFPANSPKLGAAEEQLPWETGPANKEPTLANPSLPGSKPDRADMLNNTIQQTAVWTNETSSASAAHTSEAKTSDTGSAAPAAATTPKLAGKARLQGTVKKSLGQPR